MFAARRSFEVFQLVNSINELEVLPTLQGIIMVVGLILSESYQKCRLFAERLHKHHKKKFLPPSITGFLDMDWADYIYKLQKQIGGKTWSVKESVVVFLNDSVLGGEQELFRHFRDFFYENPSLEKIKEHAQNEYVKYLNRGNILYTYMELSLDDQYMGTLLFQLRHDMLPKSSLWFTEFCTHDRFTYRGTKIHRVCKRGWFQSGEMVDQSMWSLKSLADENYSYKHDRRGILSFANNGKHTNKFQFFVTFGPAEWMDGKYVAFGRVVEGSEVLRRIENTACTYETPDREIKITDCGLAKVGLGRAIDPSSRLKGITIGTPHLHLDFFVELLFEKFDQHLYDRLDEEVKKLIVEGEWVREIIWKRVLDVLSEKRPPVEDVLDARDKSSQVYLEERYLAGLYSLPDIPDLFIKSLLEEAIQKAVERSDVKMIAKSVVDFLVNFAFDEATTSEQIADGIVRSLVKEVLRIIFGSDHALEDCTCSILGMKKALSDVSNLKSSLSDLKTRLGLGEEDVHTSKDKLSTKESVAAFIWGILLEMVENTSE